MDDLAPDRVRERDVAADVEAQPARPPTRPSSSGAGRPRTAGRRCGRRAGGGGRRSDASPGRCCPRARSGRSLQPRDMSWFRHQRRTRSPDRRQRARVRCGCSCRCCCCPGPARESFCAAKLTSLVALRAAEDPDRGPRVRAGLGGHRGAEPRDGPVERLVPGGLAELAALRVAHEGMGQANVRLRQGPCLRVPARRRRGALRSGRPVGRPGECSASSGRPIQRSRPATPGGPLE